MTKKPESQLKKAIQRNKDRGLEPAYIREQERIRRTIAASSDCSLSEQSFLRMVDSREIEGRFFSEFGQVRSGNLTSQSAFSQREWQSGERALVLEYVRILLSRDDRQVAVWGASDAPPAVVLLPTGDLARCFPDLLRLEGEDFCVFEESSGSGFLLEKNVYSLSGSYLAEGIYSLAAWGAFADEDNSIT